MKQHNFILINDIVQLRDGSIYEVIDIKQKEVVLMSVDNNEHKTLDLSVFLTQAFVVEFADPIGQTIGINRVGTKTNLAKVYNFTDYRKKVS